MRKTLRHPFGDRPARRNDESRRICGTLSNEFALMGAAGFEPAKAEPPDLQSGPFGHSGNRPKIFRSPILAAQVWAFRGEIQWRSSSAQTPVLGVTVVSSRALS